MVRDALGLDDADRAAWCPAPSSHTSRPRSRPRATAATSSSARENTTVVPFFDPLFRVVFRFELTRGLRWATTAIRASTAGETAPEPLGRHPLSTPGRFDQSQTNLIAVVSFAGVVTAFAAALFGQLGDPVAKTFHISNQGLGESLAVTRVGALIALFAAGLADRVGRRRILLASVLGVCLASGLERGGADHRGVHDRADPGTGVA